MPSELGVLLLSGSHDRAHYAFVVAAAAAALGRRVVLFATNRGCHAVCRDWSALTDAGRDVLIQDRGVAGLDTLRDACLELGVRMIACEAGLRAEAIDPALLLPGVETAGVATFLGAVGPGQIITI
jgi:peroxiredoxin family protein